MPAVNFGATGRSAVTRYSSDDGPYMLPTGAILETNALEIPGKRRWPRVESLLAGLIIASIPLGPLVSFGIQGKVLSFSVAQLMTLLLAGHLFSSKLITHVRSRTGLALGLGFSSIMLLPVLISPVLGSALAAYANYALGILGGVMAGVVYGRWYSRRLGFMDVCLAAFLVVGSAQLAISFSSAASIGSLHQNAQTPWGNSNYVAACLTVGAFVLLGRSIAVRAWRWTLVPVLVSLSAALLTLSRGAAVAMAVALGLFLWTAGRTAGQKVCLRLLSLALPLIAYIGISSLETVRFAGSLHASANIDSRIGLFNSAWNDFLSSPILGSGWVSFRAISADSVEQQSFAHNFFLSFLQMGGLLFGLTTIVTYLAVAIFAMKRNLLMAPAIAAGFTISMSDPFFEGTVGNILILMAAAYGIVAGTRPRNVDAGSSRLANTV